MRSIALIFASLATAWVQAASAQEIPGRVGRLAYTQGPVSVYQDPELGWDKAYVNTPITSENSVWTDRGARAEMRVGGTAIRLDGETQLDVSRLDEDDLDASVQRGTVNVRVRYKERNDHVTFATPHALFTIETDGRYRIDVDEERDESRLTVFGGYALMQGSSGRVPVEPGRTVIVSGRGEYDFARARETGFDRWAAVRDQQWQDSNSRRYVSYDMTGYEELDRYGTWAQDADYGAVWYPTRVSVGWTPYRDGHWTYVRPWGWTWVDDAPWGYAPSHYGRWVQVRDRWGWIPGSVRERPVWAPALVGFIGGAGFSVGISTGSPVGWYPLAPWERYDPWYRASPTYVTRVNRYVVDRAPRGWQGRGDDWRYWNRERGTTVVNRDAFVNRQRVQDAIVRMSPESIRQAPVVSSAQVVQQVLPQRSEVVRNREANRPNFAAPLVVRERDRLQQGSPQVSAPAPQQQQQVGQVVRPEFRRRGDAPMAPNPAAVVVQPPVSAPAPQAQPAQQYPQQQNPAARIDRAQQRQAEEAAHATAQQQQRAAEAQRQQQEQAQRQQQEQAQRAAREVQQQQERAARENQQQQQRQAREAQQAQERAQREAQQQQQQQAQERAAREAAQQQQQAADLQRRREEAAQRAARDTQAREQAYRQQQEAAQRAQQEAAQRAQQEAAQRAQQQQQQQQQRAQQQQQQAQERAQREAARQQQPQPAQPQQAQPQQAQPQPQPQQANPAARGDNRGRGRDKDKEDKDKEEKDKDKR